MELVCLALVGTALEDGFGIGFSEVPVRDLPFLTNADELIIIPGCNCKAVDSSHALLLGRHSLLGLQVPAKDRFVSSAGEQVLVIWEELDFGDALRVLLQV